MIQANELRIGNFIIGSDYFEFGKVLEIKKGDEMDDCDYVISYEGFGKNNNPYLFKEAGHVEPEIVFGDVTEFEPIPLTEEWLVKFGFKREISDTILYIYVTQEEDECIGVGIYEHMGEFIFYVCHSSYISKDGEWGEWIVLRYIRYVNELQNLYFALTCQELTIKQ